MATQSEVAKTMAAQLENMFASEGWKVFQRVLNHEIKTHGETLTIGISGDSIEQVGRNYLTQLSFLEGLRHVDRMKERLLNQLLDGKIPWLQECFADVIEPEE